MEKKSYTVAIDLGTSNVVVAVGARNAEGLLEIAFIGSKPVEGVTAGKIDNIDLVKKAVAAAVAEAETALGIRITEACAGISGVFVRCARHTDHVFVYDPQNAVSQVDVNALFDRMRNVQAPDDEVIMERVPQLYMVDNAREVKNPVGSFGKKLASTFNFILCEKTPIQRLEMAFKHLRIRPTAIYPNTLAIPEAVLLPEEKEEGVAVVDIGSGTTDVAVYYRNVVRYVATIPMGAAAINRDIRTMSVPEKHVENLKLHYGSAVAELAPENKMIRVTGRTAREATDILLRNLATVIEARATDIAEFVAREIADSGYAEQLGFGIVLTGGSSQLKQIDELFRRVTGMEVRLALPDQGLTEESKQLAADPAFATAVGLLLKATAQAPRTAEEPKKRLPHPGVPESLYGAFNRLGDAAGDKRGQPLAETAKAEQTETKGGGTEKPAPRDEEGKRSDDPFAEEHEEKSAKSTRNWGAFFQKTFEKINKSFSAAEDEEI